MTLPAVPKGILFQIILRAFCPDKCICPHLSGCTTVVTEGAHDTASQRSNIHDESDPVNILHRLSSSLGHPTHHFPHYSLPKIRPTLRLLASLLALPPPRTTTTPRDTKSALSHDLAVALCIALPEHSVTQSRFHVACSLNSANKRIPLSISCPLSLPFALSLSLSFPTTGPPGITHTLETAPWVKKVGGPWRSPSATPLKAMKKISCLHPPFCSNRPMPTPRTRANSHGAD